MPGHARFLRMPLDTKQVTDQGEFEGYLTVWDKPDLDGDVIERGAFSKTLQGNEMFSDNTRPLLWQHTPSNPIGTLAAKEDDQGLFIQGQINMETQLGREARALAIQGAVRGLSQGFNPVRSEPRPGGQDGRILKEIDLWEGSLVTFPAQPAGGVLAVASHMAGQVPEHLRGSEPELRAWLVSQLKDLGLIEKEQEPDDEPDDQGPDVGHALKLRGMQRLSDALEQA